MRKNYILSLFVFIAILTNQLFGASEGFTSEMKYETNYQTAITKAKLEKKPVMLIISTVSCPWCRKMENQTLKKDEINKIVHDNFTPVALDRDEDEYPEAFKPQYSPTVLFINPFTNDYFDQSVGYKPYAKFKETLEDAISNSKIYIK